MPKAVGIRQAIPILHSIGRHIARPSTRASHQCHILQQTHQPYHQGCSLQAGTRFRIQESTLFHTTPSPRRSGRQGQCPSHHEEHTQAGHTQGNVVLEPHQGHTRLLSHQGQAHTPQSTQSIQRQLHQSRIHQQTRTGIKIGIEIGIEIK